MALCVKIELRHIPVIEQSSRRVGALPEYWLIMPWLCAFGAGMLSVMALWNFRRRGSTVTMGETATPRPSSLAVRSGSIGWACDSWSVFWFWLAKLVYFIGKNDLENKNHPKPYLVPTTYPPPSSSPKMHENTLIYNEAGSRKFTTRFFQLNWSASKRNYHIEFRLICKIYIQQNNAE